MNMKSLALGLAIASAATMTMAKPVAYQIDPTHTATVFTWDHFGFSTPSGNFSRHSRYYLKLMRKNRLTHL